MINILLHIVYNRYDIQGYMEMMNLPLELWHEIGRCNPETYNILARCCRSLAQKNMFEWFFTYQNVGTYLFCVQSDGWVHSIDGVSIDGYNVLVTKYGDCIIGDNIHSYVGARFVQYNIGPLWRQVWYNNAGSEHRGDYRCGATMYYCDDTDQPESNNTLPSSIIKNVEFEWKQNGRYHRDNGPAHICIGVSEERYRQGLPRIKHALRTTDIVKHADGFIRKWYKNGLLHRNNDKPAIIVNCDDKWVYHWYRNGLLHREPGLPAVLHSDGFYEYHYHGMKINTDIDMDDSDYTNPDL